MENSLDTFNTSLNKIFKTYKDFIESQKKQKEDTEQGIINFLKVVSCPGDYFQARALLNDLRHYLSHSNPLIKTLAAKAIINIIPRMIALAYIQFGSSKGNIKGLAKELLGLMDVIKGMNFTGAISLTQDDKFTFNKVIYELIDIIVGADEEEAKQFYARHKINFEKTDEFISFQRKKSQQKAGSEIRV